MKSTIAPNREALDPLPAHGFRDNNYVGLEHPPQSYLRRFFAVCLAWRGQALKVNLSLTHKAVCLNITTV
jgi:hypothetical protein